VFDHDFSVPIISATYNDEKEWLVITTAGAFGDISINRYVQLPDCDSNHLTNGDPYEVNATTTTELDIYCA
jgi:hypothetical protein